jgi:hypothetical protein
MGRSQLGKGASGAAIALAAALVAAAAQTPAAAGSASAPTRYSIAGGCHSLAPAAGGEAIGAASRLRLQATRLGSYLLYLPNERFLAADGGDVGTATQPSPAADWTVADAGEGSFTLSPASDPDSLLAFSGGGLSLVSRSGAGVKSRFAFVPATGCATYPEAELNVTGKPANGRTSYGEVQGLLDGHMHWMNFEYLGGRFHCGRPWDPYGIPGALPDCSSVEGPLGAAAPIQNFLNYGNPVSPHDTTGWPKLTEWGRHNLTYEGTYWRWVERAWMAGLRLIVMPVNENRELCQLMVNRSNPCDEMSTALKELDDIYALQDYADAQAGGPGEGFFQIVTNPFQARRVINQGKMAVVLEVEISEPFNCRGALPSSCSTEIIDEGLDELYARGVRSSLLLNKFDNPLTGVRFDSGPIGVLINVANRDSFGSFWDAETCKGPEADNTIETVLPPVSSLLYTLITQLGLPGGALPAYPPAPHCNKRGLTDLGEHMVGRMMDMGMIVNPDHESQAGVDETITLAEERGYSGVISPHGWMDPRNWPRIFQLGGMAFPGAGSAEGFVDAWRTYRPKGTPYYSGWGYGADLGGLATQGAPAPEGSPESVTYPFKSLDGQTTIGRQVTGERTFDYSKEGVAHYGLYADWYEELRKTGGEALAQDMLRGPEAYLQMWERAVGIPVGACGSPQSDLTARGLGKLRLAMPAKALLRRAGQPIARTRAWSWCVRGNGGRHASHTAVLTRKGRVALVGSTARGNAAGGIGPGTPASELVSQADHVAPGVWTKALDGGTAAYAVRGGRVRTAAVASDQLAGNPGALRRYIHRVPKRGVQARPDRVVTSKAAKLSRKRAIPLKGRRGGAQFPAFCVM